MVPLGRTRLIAIMVSSVRPHRRDVGPKPPNAMDDLRRAILRINRIEREYQNDRQFLYRGTSRVAMLVRY